MLPRWRGQEGPKGSCPWGRLRPCHLSPAQEKCTHFQIQREQQTLAITAPPVEPTPPTLRSCSHTGREGTDTVPAGAPSSSPHLSNSQGCPRAHRGPVPCWLSPAWLRQLPGAGGEGGDSRPLSCRALTAEVCGNRSLPGPTRLHQNLNRQQGPHNGCHCESQAGASLGPTRSPA